MFLNFIIMANFKKIEVTGATKKEAMSKVADIFVLNNEGIVKGDATQAFRLWSKAQTTAITESSMNLFMSEYLRNKKAIPGEAYYITLESAVADTRERPWKVTNVKHEGGARKFKKTFVLLDAATNTILDKVQSTKTAAFERSKELIINGFHGNIRIDLSKEVEGTATVGYIEYSPSKASRPGTYLVFGIKKD